QAQLRGRETQHAFHRASQQALCGTIDQAKFPLMIEGEYGHVDFFHHCSEKRRSFEGTETLFTKRLAESVYLDHDLAHGVILARTPGAERKVFLTHGGQQIGKGLQREHHAMAKRERET